MTGLSLGEGTFTMCHKQICTYPIKCNHLHTHTYTPHTRAHTHTHMYTNGSSVHLSPSDTFHHPQHAGFHTGAHAHPWKLPLTHTPICTGIPLSAHLPTWQAQDPQGSWQPLCSPLLFTTPPPFSPVPECLSAITP